MSPSVELFNAEKYKALMDGLECTETPYVNTVKNKDFRIDSQFYTERIEYNKNLTYAPIGSYLLYSQYGVSKDMNTEGIGYPIFRMNEIHESLCDIAPEKCVELTADEFDSVKLCDGDVLFNRTNSLELVGRTGVYYDNGTPQTFASYLVRFVPDNKKIYSEYMAAFLNSCYGVKEIRRRARQSINQTNVNPEEVKAIEIPLLKEGLQKKIRACYKKAYQKRLYAAQNFYEAKECLERTICLKENEKGDDSIAIKMLSESLIRYTRLDAEFYQSKYEKYAAVLDSNETVLSLCNYYDENYIPRAETSYKYIELANVGKAGDISGVTVQKGKDLPSRARRKVKAGQIIVSSIEGSLQSCALITDEYEGALCSTGFYVLDSDSINSETLLVLFKSEPIQALMKQRCSGTILTVIGKDEFLSMPFPHVKEGVQKEIAAKVQESFALRRQSSQLLEYAKKSVEMAIEQDEDAATNWLFGKLPRGE